MLLIQLLQIIHHYKIINLYNKKTATNSSDVHYINKIIEEYEVTHVLYQDSYSDKRAGIGE